jgi:UDP-N-acetylmuramate-alanine ligase
VILYLNINDFGDIVHHLQKTAKNGDLIVVMGAGPVTTIAHALTNVSQVTS